MFNYVLSLTVCIYYLRSKWFTKWIFQRSVYRDSMYYYSISMSSPITPERVYFPRNFLFFFLYPVTAAHRVPMRDFDLHHAGKEKIARFPTIRQGDSGLISKEKKKEKTRLIPTQLTMCQHTTVPPCRDWESNKITPLYIMSKNGGICSVNLKKI